jgi:hypothetical protein
MFAMINRVTMPVRRVMGTLPISLTEFDAPQSPGERPA